jgi:hypothetical protein
MLLAVPPVEVENRWPTLGPQVCAFIEDAWTYGPGPLKGEPYRIEPEFRAEIYRLYEVYPRDHPRAGRRRFRRGALSKRKGTAKSEKAALLCATEAHPEAPVRTDGWRRQGDAWVPVGRSVQDPYIPMVAFTEEQSEDLAYAVLRSILEHSAAGEVFDIGLERVLVLDRRGREAGKIVALAGSPNARDGARTSFQHFDEPHRMTSQRLISAHTTMMQNTFKRLDADAWTLETTTAGDANERSLARDTHEYAEQIAAGKVDDPALCYIHRFCPETHPMDTPADVRSALIEASGPAASWSGDIEGLVQHWFEPKCDREYYRRVWLNQWRKSGGRAFDLVKFNHLAHPAATESRPGPPPPDGAFVTLGFDGARRQDSTALIGTEIDTGYQWTLDIWERPPDADDDWEIEASDVDAAVEEAFARFDVWRAYCDPPYWDEWVDAWAGRYGTERVVKWWTNRQRPMAHALRAFHDAIVDGVAANDGHPTFAAHIGHAVRKTIPQRDDAGVPLWLIRKDRADSPRKIDAAMAGCLSWEARRDAIASGAKPAAPASTASKVMRTRRRPRR